MICRKCKKDMVKALELFNGDLRCPLCGASIVPGQGEINVTADNDELYKLSKANFYTYLEESSKQNEKAAKGETVTKKEKDEAGGYLKRAVEFCTKAAYELHPEAITDLGYYYSKNYVNSDAGGVGRYKAAYSYFRCITEPLNFDDLTDKYTAFFNKTGSGRSGADEAARVVTKAAYYMLDMISNAPDELTEQPEYSLASVKKTMTDLMQKNSRIKLGDMNTFLDQTAAEETADKMGRIERTLASCGDKSSSHSPLFGYFEITPAEYWTVKGLSAGAPKGVIMNLLCRQNGLLEWATVGNADTERQISAGSFSEMYFCFFNMNSASKDFKKGFKAAALEGELFDKNANESLADIVNTAGKKEQVFYWDDGYFVTQNKAKLRKKAGSGGYSTITGFIMLSSGEYEDALKNSQ